MDDEQNGWGEAEAMALLLEGPDPIGGQWPLYGYESTLRIKMTEDELMRPDPFEDPSFAKAGGSKEVSMVVGPHDIIMSGDLPSGKRPEAMHKHVTWQDKLAVSSKRAVAYPKVMMVGDIPLPPPRREKSPSKITKIQVTVQTAVARPTNVAKVLWPARNDEMPRAEKAKNKMDTHQNTWGRPTIMVKPFHPTPPPPPGEEEPPQVDSCLAMLKHSDFEFGPWGAKLGQYKPFMAGSSHGRDTWGGLWRDCQDLVEDASRPGASIQQAFQGLLDCDKFRDCCTGRSLLTPVVFLVDVGNSLDINGLNHGCGKGERLQESGVMEAFRSIIPDLQTFERKLKEWCPRAVMVTVPIIIRKSFRNEFCEDGCWMMVQKKMEELMFNMAERNEGLAVQSIEACYMKHFRQRSRHGLTSLDQARAKQCVRPSHFRDATHLHTKMYQKLAQNCMSTLLKLHERTK